MEKNFRLLGLVLVVMLLMASFAGCTQQTAKNNEPESQMKTGEEANVEEKEAYAKSITLMASQNWIKDIDRELMKKFEDQTGIEVKILVTPDNGYDNVLSSALSGGSNVVDVFMYSAGTPMAAVGIPDIALDLSDQSWAGNYNEWAAKANTVDGKLLGFSTWGVDYEGIIYNKTFFEENGLELPTTWSEFIALCDEIVDLGKMPLYEGINGVWHTQAWAYSLTPVLLEENPNIYAELNESSDNKLADSAKFAEGLAQIKDLLSAKRDDGQPKYFTNDGQAEDWFGSYVALQNRDCVMMLTYSAYAAELKANGSTDEWGMFPVPLCDNRTGVSNGGGISKFINKNSDAIKESKMLLNFLAEDENLEAYYGQRSDLVSSAFKDVESVSATTATIDIEARSENVSPVMIIKDMLYWDTEIYKYMQGFAADSLTVDQFIANMDEFRAMMFEAASAE